MVRLPVPVADLARRLAERGIRAGDVNAFLDVTGAREQSVPLMGTTAACGFPSPADDYMDRPLDFNELLIQNPAATFADLAQDDVQHPTDSGRSPSRNGQKLRETPAQDLF